eukprot:9061220-Heterocapsa_arctica.AAC.1
MLLTPWLSMSMGEEFEMQLNGCSSFLTRTTSREHDVCWTSTGQALRKRAYNRYYVVSAGLVSPPPK